MVTTKLEREYLRLEKRLTDYIYGLWRKKARDKEGNRLADVVGGLLSGLEEAIFDEEYLKKEARREMGF